MNLRRIHGTVHLVLNCKIQTFGLVSWWMGSFKKWALELDLGNSLAFVRHGGGENIPGGNGSKTQTLWGKGAAAVLVSSWNKGPILRETENMCGWGLEKQIQRAAAPARPQSHGHSPKTLMCVLSGS